MTPERYLIVNADDFGQSAGVNRGIIEAHERGIVTSTSLMVRWPAAVEAAAYGRAHPELSLGLHIDLGEWAYRGETWVPVYEAVAADDLTAVTAEVSRQLTAFRRLLGQDPTHIDSHQHAHHREPLRSILAEIARDRAIPLRHYSPVVRYCGDFYGQTAKGLPFREAISVERLISILAALSPGFTELFCHPGDASDLRTMYKNEREVEVKVLCDPRVRAAMVDMGIQLRSFRDVSEPLATACLEATEERGRG